MNIHDVISNLKDEQLRRSEIVEPWHSYWYYRPQRDFPPPTIRFPRDHAGGARLSLACTQTDLPAKEQRALVAEWCEVLPQLTSVRTLWFHSRVSQELFEAACRMPDLQGLYIKWSNIQSLGPIAALTKLTHFHLGGAPSARQIEALTHLPQLLDLELSNVTAAGDVAFLEHLPELRSLELSGDGNSPKHLRIRTLKPLARLSNLQRLQISAATVADDSLAPIAQLPQLKYLLLSNQFPMEEFARLAGARPELECDRFTPTGAPVNWMACKQCGGKTMVSLTGKRKPWLCQRCDAARIDKHVAAFERIARAAAAQRAAP